MVISVSNEFNKIYSNKALHKMLTDSIISGHLCHAYLFFGPKSVGKKELCKYLAATILCSQDNKPCGDCKSCKKILNSNHPDLFVLESKDAKNSIHIEKIREIRQDAYIRPNESEYKVFILPNIQNMTAASANAFLKVLEEPPKHAVFLMTADSKQSVLETVISRCVTFEVFPASDEEMSYAVKDIVGDKSDIKSISDAIRVADGSIQNALDILNDENHTDFSNLMNDVVVSICKKDIYTLQVCMTKLNSSKEELEKGLLLINKLFAKACVAKTALKSSDDPLIEIITKNFDKLKIVKLSELLSKVHTALLQNANISLLITYFSANISKIVNEF